MKICIIAVGASSIIDAQAVIRDWGQGPWKDYCELQAHYVGSDFLNEDAWPPIFKSLYDSDFVLLDTMGVPQAFDTALVESIAGFRGQVVVANATTVAVRSLTRLGRFSLAMMRRMGADREGRQPDPARMMTMIDWMEKVGRALPVGPLRDMRNFLWISRYWLCGTRPNIESMLYLIGREYFGLRDLPRPKPPEMIEDCTIFDPVSGRTWPDVKSYHASCPPDPFRPGLGLLFRSRTYPLDTRPVIRRVIERLGNRFNIVPVALDNTLGRDFDKLARVLMPGGRPLVDVLVNPEAFRLAQGPMGGDAARGERFLRDINVPVLHPFFLTKRTGTQWLRDARGADVGEFLISIFLPELDGAIEMYPIGAVGTPRDRTPELAAFDDRIERLACRARNWSRLRRTPNHEKRVAVFLYDYPPGGSALGSASFLDSSASLAVLLRRLAADGYDTQALTQDDLKQTLTGLSRINAGGRDPGGSDGIHVDPATCRRLLRDVPGVDEIEHHWGALSECAPEGLVLPGSINGKVLIVLQPPRTGGSDTHAHVHAQDVPPPYSYAVTYRWIERVFNADTVVHLGTHGTLEFLPGKEKALSGACFPDALLGDMPHVYVYYAGNSSEAMIARRRTHAVLIGHAPPPFRKGGLYGELAELQGLLDEYAGAENLNPGRCAIIEQDMRARCAELGWPWQGMADLHWRLQDMDAALVPSRLHTLGQGYSPDEAVSYLAELFKTPLDGASGSLYARLAQMHGMDECIAGDDNPSGIVVRLGLDRHVRDWIDEHVITGRSLASGSGDELLRFYAQRGEAIAKALEHNDEPGAVLRALNGEYIAPGLSGDLFRNPDILPFGRNLVQFDPRQVPSAAAITAGAAIAGATLQRYVDSHGTFPAGTAVILWGLETSQTQGETIGQILCYLGVRIVRIDGQWDPRLELIGLEELGRPRVDVTVQICGFFRDMFPNVLTLLQGAFNLAGFAEEPDEMNHVRANARTMFDTLRTRDMQEAEAREMALARVFGPASSQYGTGVEALVRQRAWQTEADLVSEYIDSLQYAYTQNHYGRRMDGLLSENLSRVDVVSQIRSSRDYEITDLDHYYEFFGGLSRSVEQAAGCRPMMLISDTHAGRPRTEDIRDAVERGIHTRLINPAWLDGQLEHDHQGGHEIAKRMENLIGLAATTGAVGSESFDTVNRSLVFNDGMRERICSNNPHAMLDIVKRLFEASSRGYWNADDETLGRLRHIYLEIENHLEGMHS